VRVLHFSNVEWSRKPIMKAGPASSFQESRELGCPAIVATGIAFVGLTQKVAEKNVGLRVVLE